MKKQFGKLPKAGHEKIESEYHRMKLEEFDATMSEADRHIPDLIQLPQRLVETLRAVAESEGEPGYQAMVRRWIEERLQQEARLAG